MSTRYTVPDTAEASTILPESMSQSIRASGSFAMGTFLATTGLSWEKSLIRSSPSAFVVNPRL